MPFDDGNPPKSREEAHARRKRPALERFNPEKLSHWSITMVVAWIAWRDIDAVREEWDEYRSECADWLFFGGPASLVNEDAAGDLASNDIAPNDAELKRLQTRGPWLLIPRRPSGWLDLELRESREPPQMELKVAIDQLWLAAGQQNLHATAIKCESRDTLSGVESQIEAHSWPRLKPDIERSGRATLTSSDGHTFRDVRFARADLQKLWPANQPVVSLIADAIDPQPRSTPKEVYLGWIDLQTRVCRHPNREEDLEYMRSQIEGITIHEVRTLRSELAPVSWKREGRPKGSKK
jgi:hypothetical protein